TESLIRFCTSPCELFVGLILAWACGECLGAPFSGITRFEQPDGTTVELQGQGDEFHAVFETLEGYTVVFVPEARAYFYATLSENGDRLIPTSLQVGRGEPADLGLAQGIRIKPEAARDEARKKRLEREVHLQLNEKWSRLKDSRKDGPGPVPQLL